jgi:hypothetical protein
MKFDKIASVIRQQPESAKTFDKLRTSPGNVSTDTWYQDNIVRAARKFFNNAVVIVFV